MSPRTRKKALALLRELRERCPPLLPVRVRFVRMKDCGECSLVPGSHFVIRVRERASWWVVRDTLVHEWAHALAWRDGPEGSAAAVMHHDAEWGVAYARIHQDVLAP